MKNSLKIILSIICVWFTVSVNHAQLIRVIDHKGTPKDVDNSKWQLSGSDIYYKFGGKVGIGTNNPGAQLHTTGTIMFSGLGTNSTHTIIMTTDGSGNVSTRSLANILNGNAMTSLNGLTNSVQTFSIGTAGTNIGITSSGSTHTFNIPTASATNRGALSSGDWTNFNNKIGLVTATTPAAVTMTGTDININNTASHWNANQLTGRNIANTTPMDGQVLTWDATLSTWKPAVFGVFPVVTVAGASYTLSAADHGKILDFTSNSAISLTVPSSLAAGFQVSITQAGTGQITIAGSGGMSVNNRWGGTTTSGRWAKAGLEVRATNSSVLSGDVQ